MERRNYSTEPKQKKYMALAKSHLSKKEEEERKNINSRGHEEGETASYRFLTNNRDLD